MVSASERVAEVASAPLVSVVPSNQQAAVDAVPLEEIDVSRPELFQNDAWRPWFARLRSEARSTLDIASVPQSAQTSSTSSSEALYIQARFVEGRKAESWPPK
jgi:hypothetical protein